MSTAQDLAGIIQAKLSSGEAATTVSFVIYIHSV